eukprot:TRINITY_DN14347_c0_g1_i1.p1 TRINITY_DN14347_c0_g1~~TRINITY_DN14347_c0_g1_i1.p1  ORF type:complete len:271 (-),score=25.45 TRINITY_DN14347_c0_g1_i1:27-839(-)
MQSRIATPIARKLSRKPQHSRRYYSFESGKRNLVSHGGTSGEKEWWKTEAHLVKKTKESPQTHIIFLEGLCGTGKADLLWRLSRMQLSGLPDTFHHFAQQHRSDLADLDRLNTLWADSLMSKVKDLASKKHKSNVLFINRSPVSSWAHVRSSKTEKLMTEFLDWTKTSNASIIWCLSDDLRRQERMGQRILSATGDHLQLRNDLGELEINGDYLSSPQQLATAQAYQQLLEAGKFDSSIATTSAKQATSRILEICVVEFQSFFDRPGARS